MRKQESKLESVRMHTQERVCKRKRVGKSEREGGRGHNEKDGERRWGNEKATRERTDIHACIHTST